MVFLRSGVVFFGRRPKGKNAKVEANGIAPHVVASAVELTNLAAPANGDLLVPVGLVDEESKRRMVAARQAFATFGEIVTLLMRTPEYRPFPLGDLESLVLPPLFSGQVSVATAQVKNNGGTAPVGAILWARVSEEVANRLAVQVGKPIRLAPEDWKSGDIVWIMASAGDGRVLSEMLKQLSKRQWTGKEVRIVVRPKDGKPTVAKLVAKSSEAA